MAWRKPSAPPSVMAAAGFTNELAAMMVAAATATAKIRMEFLLRFERADRPSHRTLE